MSDSISATQEQNELRHSGIDTRRQCSFGHKCKLFAQHKEPHSSAFRHDAEGLNLKTNSYFNIASKSCPIHDLPDGSRNSPVSWAEMSDTRCTCGTRQVRRLLTEDRSEPELIVYIIRHGERLDKVDPFWANKAERPFDPPITDLGRAQARATGDALRNERLSAIYVSPFIRCVQTAAGIVEGLSTSEFDQRPSVVVHAGLSELLFRKWFTVPPQLLSPTELQAHYHLLRADAFVSLPRRRPPARDLTSSPTTGLAAISLTEERDVDIVTPTTAMRKVREPDEEVAEVSTGSNYNVGALWPETRPGAAIRVAMAVRSIVAAYTLSSSQLSTVGRPESPTPAVQLLARPQPLRRLLNSPKAALPPVKAPAPVAREEPAQSHEAEVLSGADIATSPNAGDIDAERFVTPVSRFLARNDMLSLPPPSNSRPGAQAPQQQPIPQNAGLDLGAFEPPPINYKDLRQSEGCPVIAFVTHGGVVAGATAALAATHINGSQVRLCSLTKLVRRGGRWTCEDLNSTAHLRGLEVALGPRAPVQRPGPPVAGWDAPQTAHEGS